MKDPRPPAIFLMGPTAAGKTALAFALREAFPVELISVDAAQVYRGMDIGTAKPTSDEQARAPHRLIDIREPTEAYSAAEFRTDALREMAAIAQQGRIPLLVGGTMFYFRALEYGLADLPSADPAVRTRLSAEAEQLGWPALHARLKEYDPETAAHIEPHDPQRIQRALEIIELTGDTPSALSRRQIVSPFPYRLIKIALCPPERKTLHSQITVRFERMLQQGLVEEVTRLYRRGDLSLALPSMRTVGYRQVWQYLTKEINYYEMVERSLAATRQLAKRQLTWLRSDKGTHWMDGTDTQLVANSVLFVRQSLQQEVIL